LLLVLCLVVAKNKLLMKILPPPPKLLINLPNVVNPFSISNVEKAQATLNANKQTNTNLSTPSAAASNLPKFIYFKFNPRQISADQFLALENDTTVKLMEIPFANAAIYGDGFALNTAKAEQLKDGNIYGVTTISNTSIFSKLSSGVQLQYLDTLVKIPETDTALQYQALRQSGITEQEISIRKICLLKKPHGTVRYRDNELGRMEPVRGMEVWSLYFGIPMITYTDNDGYYEIPWRYNVGTIMGTKAKNGRVNVKPLDTRGTLAREFYTLLTQFIVGSLHVEGWVTTCQMRDGRDINFEGHTQVRYWSQILNAYSYHDQYTNTDGIKSAPRSMVCYAQWGNTNATDRFGNPDFGQASTFMLGHINMPAAWLELFINDLFDGNVNLVTEYPYVFNALVSLLPDMSFRVPQEREPLQYSSRFTQLAFHELSHASHFRQVGNLWWINLAGPERPKHSVPGNPYGDGSATNAGKVALTESWAEFLGMNYQIKRYGQTSAFNLCTNRNTYQNTIGGLFETIVRGTIYRSTQLQENQFWFFGGRWIPMGIYHDLMDDSTDLNSNRTEDWDRINGVTIKQMYDAFAPNIGSMCDYEGNFLTRNTLLNQTAVIDIFNSHSINCQ
jgi:hypothetical protein